jgi:TRAP-type mannitol/chloroaromatic compound transport system permease large subunit
VDLERESQDVPGTGADHDDRPRWAPAPARDRDEVAVGPRRGGRMEDSQVALAIAVLEQALAEDDPGLSRRLDRLERRTAWHFATVFVLLVLGTVLIAAGLGTASAPAWLGGVGALVLSVVVDRWNEWRLRRTSCWHPR